MIANMIRYLEKLDDILEKASLETEYDFLFIWW